ncbi:hypothetical protein H2198_003788 [Neophaeococcomyces mojaviensis]|uniref:Uncharacterized protein n=1 Tax=Neophaeococcomyces mojaviensis TaxID=3383035 RepID=A0ACC3AAI6_9EURO|nr:hypothetical protein H2198_003788 [Knufia sp. JES_112]
MSSKQDEKLDRSKAGEEQQARLRDVALRHALSIEDKKKLQGKVLDMILVAFDLPSDTTDPAHPSATDTATFKECLALFRPSDLDELVDERNIDERCGYALCAKPKLKQDPSKSKVWNPKTGKLVEKADLKKWCSVECKERNKFVRKQLSEEAVWLRQNQTEEIRLMTDAPEGLGHTLAANADGPSDKLEILSHERGEAKTRDTIYVEIHEKEPQKVPEPPKMAHNEMLEGLPIRTAKSSRTHD